MTEQSPARRYPLAAVAALAVAALCLWASSRLSWVRVESSDGLGEDRVDTILGGTWAATLTPFALVFVAAIAAVFAVRGWVLKLFAGLIVAVGVAAAVPAVALLAGSATNDRAGRLAELPGRAEVTGVQTHPAAALLALLGGVVSVVAGLLLLRRNSAQRGLSAKYDRRGSNAGELAKVSVAKAAETGDAETSQRVLWDALDAGNDPTADDRDDDGTRR
ncbi:TIGR02234 family membrane protein [Antrihabitans sp. NCIMB 15449]|uniref:TIGR02234 family membrane protein n=1 Tax=Antrihabitans spumae TaxID=3373370 RepID=A0ABW7JUF4_9NOCA